MQGRRFVWALILAQLLTASAAALAQGVGSSDSAKQVYRLLGPADVNLPGSPAVLANLRYVSVNIAWHGEASMPMPFDTAVFRNAIVAELRRDGLQVSTNPRVLFDSAGVELTLYLTSFPVRNVDAVVSGLQLAVTDLALLRRVSRKMSVVPIWVSSLGMQMSPTNQHENAMLAMLRTSLDLLTNAIVQAKEAR